ncbi:uncharacterized protein KY384_002285 [Bacidia gigantensis]|uniref:uncharacterized protein n=1 Tax=Bacidia gigantensis TaxID=2732470 RepID=UPI001D040F1E|nr:uncharacterized protein KY384_002285 [Bacidia gigantensis]KAG8533500.1 hypothetical protein KY384_002285 [Bacidia gigantensis]
MTNSANKQKNAKEFQETLLRELGFISRQIQLVLQKVDTRDSATECSPQAESRLPSHQELKHEDRQNGEVQSDPKPAVSTTGQTADESKCDGQVAAREVDSRRDEEPDWFDVNINDGEPVSFTEEAGIVHIERDSK